MKQDEHYLARELRSEASAFALLETSVLDGIWLRDLDKPEHEWTSPRFWQLLGYSAEQKQELVSEWQALVHPEDLSAESENLAKHRADPNYIYDQYLRFTRADGLIAWVRRRGVMIRDHNGHASRMFGTYTDVTPLKQAVEAAQKSSERTRQLSGFLDSLVESIPLMIFVKDAARLAFVRFNQAGEALLGVDRAELIGKNDYDFFPKHEADFFQAKDRETLHGKRLVEIPEEPIDTKHGRRLLRTKKVPILDEAGEPQYLLGISEDITERKKSEEARHRLAAIVDNSDDAIISTNLEGLVTSWNKSAERIFGYRADEMLGQPVTKLFPLSRKEDESGAIERFRRHERIDHFETVRLRKDGSEIDVSITLSPVRNSEGELIGVSKIARDISELKRIQRELVRAKETAEAANRELESFSYSVAHDLRAPLRSIDGFSQALIEDYADKLDEDGRKYLHFVRSSAQRMAELIDDLLTLARVTRSELNRQPTSLSSMAHAAMERLRRLEPERQVEVVLQQGLSADGDPRLLSVVFDNLLGNAWKFSAKSPAARIEFGATRNGERTIYFVRDNGAGFDMAFANKLFGVFQRLHTSKDFEGTGVGLATVQRIIHRHGGEVWAESQINAGATFYFTLNEKGSPS